VTLIEPVTPRKPVSSIEKDFVIYIVCLESCALYRDTVGAHSAQSSMQGPPRSPYKFTPAIPRASAVHNLGNIPRSDANKDAYLSAALANAASIAMSAAWDRSDGGALASITITRLASRSRSSTGRTYWSYAGQTNLE
jgi:hypothetical protein